MAKQLLIRMTGALGLVSLAVVIVGLIPFLGADASSGAALMSRTPTFSVNREFKGDRLPMPSNVNTALLRDAFRSQRSRAPEAIPDGCDPAFSPISAPRLAYVYGRCTT
jgi:hypothetical protein